MATAREAASMQLWMALGYVRSSWYSVPGRSHTYAANTSLCHSVAAPSEIELSHSA